MKLQRLLTKIKSVFGREGEFLTTTPILQPQSETSNETNLVDASLLDTIRFHNIDLSTINIETLGFTPAIISSLQKANIFTIEQLSDSKKIDLYNLYSIGITKLAHIENELNLFLKIMIKAKEVSARQIDSEPTITNELLVQEHDALTLIKRTNKVLPVGLVQQVKSAGIRESAIQDIPQEFEMDPIG